VCPCWALYSASYCSAADITAFLSVSFLLAGTLALRIFLLSSLSEAIYWDLYSWTASQLTSLGSVSYLISFCLLCNSDLAWATFLRSFWALASLIFPTYFLSLALNMNCFWLRLNLNFSTCRSSIFVYPRVLCPCVPNRF